VLATAMNTFASSIRGKLTRDELQYLAQELHVDLTNPAMVLAHEELSAAADRLRVVEEAAMRRQHERDGVPACCSFCLRPPSTAGAMAKSQHGPYICRECATRAISEILRESQGDG
jgi:ClpX C4-type zinc finger